MNKQSSVDSYRDTLNGKEGTFYVYDDRGTSSGHPEDVKDLDCRSFLDDIVFYDDEEHSPHLGNNYGVWMLSRSSETLDALKEDLRLISKSFALDNKMKLRASTIAGIVDAAIYQIQSPECTECSLKGCDSCNGLGRVRITNKDLYSMIGIDRHSVSNNHISIFEHLVSLMNSWHRDIATFFADELGQNVKD